MKRIILLLALSFVFNAFGQTKSDLVKHYEAYYKQMKKQGDVQGVINALTHLNVIAPNQPRIDTLSYIYTAEGRFVEALNTIGLEDGATDSDLNTEVKAVALKSINQPKRALVFYEKLFSKEPNPLIAYEMADLKIQIGDLDGAIKNIEYGLANVKEDMKHAFYERNQPYEVSLKAAFIYLKGLVVFNQNKETNIDAAIKLLDEAIALEPQFNLAILSKDALMARKTEGVKKE